MSGFKGKANMVSNARKFTKNWPDVVARGLYVETEIETTEVKKRTPVYVGPPGPGKPVPGVLRGSVHTEGPFREGRRVWTHILAGGAAWAYAIQQHENLSFFHKVGQAKYLESVIMESRPFMAQRVAHRIDITKVL